MKKRYRIIFQLLLIIGSLCSGCQPKRDKSEDQDFSNRIWNHPTQQQIAELRKFLENYNNVGTVDNRDPKYNPEAVIPQIHPWLAINVGMKRRRIDANYEAYILKQIPQNVLDDLKTELYLDSYPVPLMILRRSFWVRVRDLQSKGFTIGFKVYVPNTADEGVYIDGANTFLFDTFAEYGTLTHEYEHYRQYQRLKVTHDHWITNNHLSQNCIDNFGRFLAEVDATTAELPEWISTFKTYDYKPQEAKDLTSTFGVLDFFFYRNMLAGNLSYPEFAFQWVLKSECPQNVKDTAFKIADQTAKYNEKMSNITRTLLGVKMGYEKACADANTICSGSADQWLPENQSTCQQDQVFLKGMDAEAATSADQIDRALWQGYEDRINFVRQTLGALPEDYQKVFCKNALAYSFLGDCR